VVSAV